MLGVAGWRLSSAPWLQVLDRRHWRMRQGRAGQALHAWIFANSTRVLIPSLR
jgi:hypothetical protein